LILRLKRGEIVDAKLMKNCSENALYIIINSMNLYLHLTLI